MSPDPRNLKHGRRRAARVVRAATVLAVLSTLTLTPTQASAQPYPIGGAIRTEYDEAGGFAFFGNALNPESDAARGGRWQEFEKNSSIYWHPLVSDGHANEIGGAIRAKWGDLGWENGALRYPTSREMPTRKPGRFNQFEGGTIHWSPSTGAHNTWGAIRDKWATLSWEDGRLGFPVTDEFPAKNNGAGQHFEGGSIYWSASTGARVISGAIRDTWASQNWENGRYGYPISDEYDYNGGRAQDFQGGRIEWHPPR
ncbi:LGFP repeat-containing protein [Nocardia sp. NPDC050175]|uniref:LGFP repeat-containing protein n=1 Tax=Nocardia sp. NPDC050175 TaxID=3364317 RepID=UPI0037982E6C